MEVLTMKQKNNTEQELNEIRVSIYEEIKGMTPFQMTAYMKAQVAPIENKYGIQAISEIDS